MANITIGQLTGSTYFSDSDTFPIYIEQQGTRKITGANLKNQLFTGINIESSGITPDSSTNLVVQYDGDLKKVNFNAVIEEVGQEVTQNFATLESIYGAGNQIADGEDLNDYIGLGRYYYTGDNTITNSPCSGQFNLMVEQISENNYSQTVKPVNTYAYATRNFSIEEGSASFDNWKYLPEYNIEQ